MTGLVARDGAGLLTLRPLPEQDSATLLSATMGERAAAEPADALATLARLCAHLPLALRIAAANLATRPGYQLCDYVEKLSSGDRLTGLAVPDDPQAAVRSAFDLSCDVLAPAERRMFRLVGLLPGSDLTVWWAAALAGCGPGEAESLLDRLAARNLVDDYASGRYRLHDLLRLYATELLDVEEDDPGREAALDRLGRQAVSAVASAADLLYPHLLHLPGAGDDQDAGFAPGPGQATLEAPFTTAAQAHGWLDAERANLVALVAQLSEQHRNKMALQLADRLTGYFFLRSNTVDWLVSATAAHQAATRSGDPAGMAATEMQLGMLREAQSDHEVSSGHFAEAARLARRAGWTAAEAVALNNLASSRWAAGHAQETIDGLNEALNLHRRSGRKAGEAVTLANLAAAHLELARSSDLSAGQAAADQHRHQALSLLGQALGMHRDLGDQRNEAETHRRLAEAHRDLDQLDLAAGHARHALELARQASDLRFEVTARSTLATILVGLGESGTGLTEHKLAVDLAEQTGEERRHVVVLAEFAESLARLGRHQEALARAQEAAAAAARLDLPFLLARTRRLIGEATRA